jgi:hypothetical protein
MNEQLRLAKISIIKFMMPLTSKARANDNKAVKSKMLLALKLRKSQMDRDRSNRENVKQVSLFIVKPTVHSWIDKSHVIAAQFVLHTTHPNRNKEASSDAQ